MQLLGPKVNVFKTYPAWRIQLLKENKNQTNTAIQIRSQTQLGKIRIQALRVFFFFWVCVGTYMEVRGQLLSQFSPSTKWVSEIKFRSSGLELSTFTLWAKLPGPKLLYKNYKQKNQEFEKAK